MTTELSQRFGLPFWQFALSASDANRFIIRWARAATGRNKILIFNGCYHGTVDDVFVDLIDGKPSQRDSLLGQVYDLTQHTKVVEFNDLTALEQALKDNDVACVLAESVMMNIGMVLPQADYWQKAQAMIKAAGSLLIIDETHTISTGPGGYARAHNLQPDCLVVGKSMAGGVPCAVYGMRAEIANKAVCSSTGNVSSQLATRLAAEIKQGKVNVVSVSFDPAHDTPEHLSDYRQRLDRSHGLWEVARPISSAANKAMMRTFGVVAIDDGLGGFDHNAALHVVDKSGRLVCIHEIDALEEVENDVKKML